MFQLDQNIFYFINSTLSNGFFDQIMPTLTDLHKEPFAQYCLVPLLLLFWFYKEKSRMLPLLLGLVITVGATDFACYRLLKPSFKRQRPPAIESTINIRTDRYAGYSFPSSHAANNFAFATYLSLCYPALTPFLVLIATFGAFSRVYVGVHYPLDVLAGALVGCFFGLFFFRLFVIILKEKFIKPK
jgi:undecaprenyl-diphosphatase